MVLPLPAAPPAPGPPPPTPAGGLDGQGCCGIVVSYNLENGFGFIQADGVPDDIYFRGDGCDFQVGMQVAFYLKPTPDRRFHARNVMCCLEDGETYEGNVSSFGQRHGYGFITVQNYPEQIYFRKALLPQYLQEDPNADLRGCRVRFVAQVLKNGKCRAASFELCGDDAGAAENGQPLPEPPGGEVPAGYEEDAGDAGVPGNTDEDHTRRGPIVEYEDESEAVAEEEEYLPQLNTHDTAEAEARHDNAQEPTDDSDGWAWKLLSKSPDAETESSSGGLPRPRLPFAAVKRRADGSDLIPFIPKRLRDKWGQDGGGPPQQVW